jgi:hypothetical protein
MEWVIAPDPDWRLAGEGSHCRHLVRHSPVASPDGEPGVAHGEPAIAEKHVRSDGTADWRGYCADHFPDDRWIEDGKVMMWQLRRSDGTPATRAQVTSARRSAATRPGDWCSQHQGPRSACDPASRHTWSMRVSDETMHAVEAQARALGLDRNAGIEQALEAWLGSESAKPSRESSASRTAPSSVVQDRAGALKTARERAEDKGAVITTASELAAPPAAAAVPVFKAGPDVDCPHENVRVKGVCPDCKQWVGGKR